MFGDHAHLLRRVSRSKAVGEAPRELGCFGASGDQSHRHLSSVNGARHLSPTRSVITDVEHGLLAQHRPDDHLGGPARAGEVAGGRSQLQLGKSAEHVHRRAR